MLVTAPVTFADGSPLLAADVCRDIFHTGANPSAMGGEGAGEVYQGRIEQDNLAFTLLPRSAVRRRTFHGVCSVASTGVNLDFTQELFQGVVVNDGCVTPGMPEAAVPVPGAVRGWHNRWVPRALEVRFGLVLVVGAKEPVQDYTVDAYNNLVGAWRESAWAGMFVGTGKSAQFINGVDNYFPLGQTQSRDAAGSTSVFTAATRDYSDVRTWTDRFVLDADWLADKVPGLLDKNNPLLIGEQSLGLRLACDVQIARVKRAYLSVLPLR